MEIHVQKLLAKGTVLHFRESLNADWLRQVRADVTGAGELKADLKASGADGAVLVEGELSIDVELACSRCLDPVREHLVIPFEARFKTAAAEEDGEDEDEEIGIVSEDKVDLEPYIEETLMLSLPFAPLCGEDCKGLCHTCGANLNTENCGCVKDDIDPRMAALKDLFKP